MSMIDDVINVALGQLGKPYRVGGNWERTTVNPPYFDCSEFTEWVCLRAGTPQRLNEASYLQYWQCKDQNLLMPLSQGLATRGALLFNFRSPAGQVEPPRGNPTNISGHVAFSMGDGTAVGAHNTQVGVAVRPASSSNYAFAARIPGVGYSGQPAPTPSPAPTPAPSPGGRAAAYRPRPDLPYLVKGSPHTQRVKELQYILISLGDPELPQWGATGKFGDVTFRAVKRFQARVAQEEFPAMVVDGEVGPVTWGWLWAYAA